MNNAIEEEERAGNLLLYMCIVGNGLSVHIFSDSCIMLLRGALLSRYTYETKPRQSAQNPPPSPLILPGWSIYDCLGKLEEGKLW